jgi:hypothetical protein
MKFMSFLRFFGKRWLRGKPRRNRFTPRPARAELLLESLEHRVMLSSSPPTIVSVVPVDHSVTATQTPAIQITFSEKMVGNNALHTGASDPTNYVLLDSNGTSFSVDTATLNGTGTVVTLGYNMGGALPSNTYTLFVHGDRLVAASDSLPLAQPGEVFSANNGQNNIAVASISSDGTFGAGANYAQPTTITTTFNNPVPWAVAHGDFNSDGIPDLAVANAVTNQVAIFAGRNPARGGAFNLTPTLVLNLPISAGNTPLDTKSIVVGDFNNDGLPDIAVASSDSNTVSVFLNTSTSVGSMSFGTPLRASAGATPPIGMVAADFNLDGSLDLAVVNSQPSVAVGTSYFCYPLDERRHGENGTVGGIPDHRLPGWQDRWEQRQPPGVGSVQPHEHRHG